MGTDAPHRDAGFYDGLSARRRNVALSFGDDLTIFEGTEAIARWRYADIRRVDESKAMLRLSSAGVPEPARLEVTRPAHRDEIARRCPALADGVAAERRAGLRIAGWATAAAVSLVLMVVYGIPLLAGRIAPLVPWSVEKRIGEAAESQVKALLGGGAACGIDRPDAAGSRALAKLRDRLSAEAGLPVPLQVSVIRHDQANAFAVPGGRIVILDALLRRARNPDEVAGVLAHEIGHVANRDGMRKLIQVSGVSFVIGLVLGDFTGAGAIVLGTQTLVNSSFSRDVEREADAFALAMMARMGRSPVPMGELLVRLTGEGGPPSRVGSLLASHPMSAERLETFRRAGVGSGGPPLLDEAEWQALRQICRTLPAGAAR